MIAAVGGIVFLGDGIVIGTAGVALRPDAAERHGNATVGGRALQLIPHGIVGCHIRKSRGIQTVQRHTDILLLTGIIPHEIAVEIEERALGIQIAPLVADQLEENRSVGGIGGVRTKIALPQGDGGGAVFVGDDLTPAAESVAAVEETESAGRGAVKESGPQGGRDGLPSRIEGLIEGNQCGVYRLLIPGDGFIYRGNGIACLIHKGQTNAVAGKIRVRKTAVEGAVGGYADRTAARGIGRIFQRSDSLGGGNHAPEVYRVVFEIGLAVGVDIHTVPRSIRHRGADAHVAGFLPCRDHRQGGITPLRRNAAQSIFIRFEGSDGHGVGSVGGIPQAPSGHAVVQIYVHLRTGHSAVLGLQPQKQILTGGNGGYGYVRHLKEYLSVKGIGGHPRFAGGSEGNQIAALIQNGQESRTFRSIRVAPYLGFQGVRTHFGQALCRKYVFLAGQHVLARNLFIFHQSGRRRTRIPIPIHGADGVCGRDRFGISVRIYKIGKFCLLAGIGCQLPTGVAHGDLFSLLLHVDAEGGGGGIRSNTPRRQGHAGIHRNGVGSPRCQFLLGNHHHRFAVLIDLHAEIHYRSNAHVLRQIRPSGQHLIESKFNTRIGRHARGPIGRKHSRNSGSILRLEHKGSGAQQSGGFRLSIGDAETVKRIQLQRRAGTHSKFRPLARNFHIRHRRDPQIAGKLLGSGLPAGADSEDAVRRDHTPLGRVVGHGDLPQGFGNIRVGTLHADGVIQGDNGHFFLLFRW